MFFSKKANLRIDLSGISKEMTWFDFGAFICLIAQQQQENDHDFISKNFKYLDLSKERSSLRLLGLSYRLAVCIKFLYYRRLDVKDWDAATLKKVVDGISAAILDIRSGGQRGPKVWRPDNIDIFKQYILKYNNFKVEIRSDAINVGALGRLLVNDIYVSYGLVSDDYVFDKLMLAEYYDTVYEDLKNYYDSSAVLTII